MKNEDLILTIRASSYYVHATAGGAWGSGIAITNRHIATARHVYDACGQNIYMKGVTSGKRVNPRIIRTWGKDIAIIETKEPLPSWIPPSPKPVVEYKSGDLVFSWASSSVIQQLRPIVVQVGFLVGPSFDSDTDFTINLGTYPGCSGAGIVHESGVVIGVVCETLSVVEGVSEKERALTYATDIYPAVKDMGIIEAASEEKPILSPLKWWSKELTCVGLGLVLGYILSR